MMKTISFVSAKVLAFVVACSLFSIAELHAAETQCKLQFTLKSWSFFYKSGKGSGVVTCDNGQRAKVKIRAQGGGITFGKDKILNGHGTFSRTPSINDVFGSYATAEAHGGAGDSGASQAMTKGDISLALTGSGKGINAGISFGKFKITKR